LYFLAEDLPPTGTPVTRADAAMGSPDPRQIDGMGGATRSRPKVAWWAGSARADADVDYLFLQVWPDRARSATTRTAQPARGVGPFALEEGC